MWIVIEAFDMLFPIIVSNEDGMPKLFDTEDEAQAEADECQDGRVILI